MNGTVGSLLNGEPLPLKYDSFCSFSDKLSPYSHEFTLKLFNNVGSMLATSYFCKVKIRLRSRNKNGEIEGEAQEPVGNDYGSDRAAAERYQSEDNTAGEGHDQLWHWF